MCDQRIVLIADHYGLIHQTHKAQEELAECYAALQNTVSFEATDESVLEEVIKMSQSKRENLAEEIADVRIMLEQIEYLHSLEDEVAAQREFKLNRQLNRMGANHGIVA